MQFEKLLKPLTKPELRRLRNRWKRVLAVTAKVSELHPQHAVNFRKCDLFNLAYIAAEQRNENLLEELLTEHEQLEPGNKNFHRHIEYNRACIRISERKFREAIEMFDGLLAGEHVAHRSHILHHQIDLYFELQEYKQAVPYVYQYLENWDREASKEKDYVSYAGMPFLLQVLALAGEIKEVIRIGTEIIDHFGPGNDFVLFLVGQSYLELKDDLRALHYFTLALNLKPDYPEIYMNLGAFYGNERNDFQKCREYMELAITACGDRPEYKRLEADIYRNLAVLSKEALDLDTAGEYRRKQFEAMSALEIFDLLVLFGPDEESMNEYQIWAENHPEIYEKYFGEEDEDEQPDEEEMEED